MNTYGTTLGRFKKLLAKVRLWGEAVDRIISPTPYKDGRR